MALCDWLCRINQRTFMDSCKLYKQGAAAVAFLHALPKRFHDIRLYNMVLQVRCWQQGQLLD